MYTDKDAYDIAEAFSRIEKELIDSMIRNFKRHRAEETAFGFDWAQWQVLQLESLEAYKKANAKRYGKRFKSINAHIDRAIRNARVQGGADEEIRILQAVKRGAKLNRMDEGISRQFFQMNDRSMNALIEATGGEFRRAETAILRQANDQYRRVIFNAQVYASSGAGTYEKAVDMATADFVKAGLNCITYANGARHTLADYADMAIKTATKRAYLVGEGEKRQEWGVHTVFVNYRNSACPKCAPFCGHILIDDTYGGGTAEESQRTGYPLLSSAIKKGFLHPRCKDVYSTWFPGISAQPKKMTKAEQEAAIRQEEAEQVENRHRLARERKKRLADTRLEAP